MSLENEHDDTGPKTSRSRSASPKPDRGQRRHPNAGSSVGWRWYGTDAAAEKLDIEPPALRQRVRRCSRNENGQIVARLGMGVVARKFGKTWRFFFGEEDSANAT